MNKPHVLGFVVALLIGVVAGAAWVKYDPGGSRIGQARNVWRQGIRSAAYTEPDLQPGGGQVRRGRQGWPASGECGRAGCSGQELGRGLGRRNNPLTSECGRVGNNRRCDGAGGGPPAVGGRGRQAAAGDGAGRASLACGRDSTSASSCRLEGASLRGECPRCIADENPQDDSVGETGDMTPAGQIDAEEKVGQGRGWRWLMETGREGRCPALEQGTASNSDEQSQEATQPDGRRRGRAVGVGRGPRGFAFNQEE